MMPNPDDIEEKIVRSFRSEFQFSDEARAAIALQSLQVKLAESFSLAKFLAEASVAQTPSEIMRGVSDTLHGIHGVVVLYLTLLESKHDKTEGS